MQRGISTQQDYAPGLLVERNERNVFPLIFQSFSSRRQTAQSTDELFGPWAMLNV